VSTAVVILIFLVHIFFGVIVSSPVIESIAAAGKRPLTLRKCNITKVLQKQEELVTFSMSDYSSLSKDLAERLFLD
jgi:hypothetical protein